MTPTVDTGIRPRPLVLGVEVRVPSEDRCIVGIASEVTAGGIFVSTLDTVEEGTEVIVELTLPAGTIHAEGIVAAPPPREGRTSGVFVALEAVLPRDRVRLEKLAG